MVVRRGINEASVLPMARWARDEGLILRFIEYMDVGHTNGWRMDDVVPADELVALVDARDALEQVPPRYLGRGRRPLPLPRRQRRGRADRLGHAAILRRLHPRAPVRRGPLLHLPVHRGGARPPGRSSATAAAAATRTLRDRIADIWRVRDDRYSDLRTEATSSRLPRIEMFAMGG